MYSNEWNISCIVDLHEKLFLLRQGNRTLFDYCSVLKGTLDEVDFYKPLVLDLNVFQQYYDELSFSLDWIPL